jgi:hypothetical protein
VFLLFIFYQLNGMKQREICMRKQWKLPMLVPEMYKDRTVKNTQHFECRQTLSQACEMSIKIVRPANPSVHTHQTTPQRLKEFLLRQILKRFTKICQCIRILVHRTTITDTLHGDVGAFLQAEMVTWGIRRLPWKLRFSKHVDRPSVVTSSPRDMQRSLIPDSSEVSGAIGEDKS